MALAALENAGRQLARCEASQSMNLAIRNRQHVCHWPHRVARFPARDCWRPPGKVTTGSPGQGAASSSTFSTRVGLSACSRQGKQDLLDGVRLVGPASVYFQQASFSAFSYGVGVSAAFGDARTSAVDVQTIDDGETSERDDTIPSYDFRKEKIGSNLPSLESGLYLVGTPIGNLEDMTFRALRVLQTADLIMAEDTRHSGKLLSYFGIKTPMISFHLHNEQSREAEALQKLRAGKVVAVISDAGMPGISDPGMELVEKCVEAQIPVIPIPGPSAVITALVASGLPTYEFTFVGFLPPDKSARRKRLAFMKESKPTQIMFVGPHKLAATLADAAEAIGPDRRCVVAREMTKMFEEFYRGTLSEAAAAFRPADQAEGPSVKRKRPESIVRGEVTLLVEGFQKQDEEEISEDDIVAQLLELKAAGASVSDASRKMVEVSGLRKKKIYRLALDLWKDD